MVDLTNTTPTLQMILENCNKNMHPFHKNAKFKKVSKIHNLIKNC